MTSKEKKIGECGVHKVTNTGHPTHKNISTKNCESRHPNQKSGRDSSLSHHRIIPMENL